MKRLPPLILAAGLALAACAGNPPGDLPPSRNSPEPPDAVPTQVEPPPTEPTDTPATQVEPPPTEPTDTPATQVEPPPTEPADTSPTQEEPPIEDLEGPPLIRLIVNDVPVEGYQGSYCWTGPAGGLCVDKIPPAFDSAYALPVGEPIRLLLDAPVPDTVTLTLHDEVFGPGRFTETFSGAERLEWHVQAGPGEYVLSVFAAWEAAGDVSYLFSILLAG